MEAIYILSCLAVGGWSAWSCLDSRVHDGLIGKLALAAVALGCLGEICSTLAGAPVSPGRALLLGGLAAVGTGHLLHTCRPYQGSERRKDASHGTAST